MGSSGIPVFTMRNDFCRVKSLPVDKVRLRFKEADCAFRDDEPKVIEISFIVEGTG